MTDTDEEFLQIKELLESGERPDDIENAFTRAVNTCNSHIIDLLIQYGVKPTTNYLKKLATQLVKQYDVLPKHITFINEAYEKLATSLMTEENKSDLNLMLVHKYHEFFHEIEEAKQVAEKANKPLMVIIGESHYGHDGINALLSELMTLYIAFKKFDIKTVMTEALEPSEEERLVVDPLKWKASVDVYQFISNCKKDVIVIDESLRKINLHYISQVEILSEKCTKSRNDDMAERAINHSKIKKEDVVTIVGSAHLKGLIEETNLKDYYHILAINTSPTSDILSVPGSDNIYLRECCAYEYSKSIVQSQIINDQNNIYMSPAMAFNFAKTIHKQEKGKLIPAESSLETTYKHHRVEDEDISNASVKRRRIID